jgi:uncharacterized membrane protein
MEPTVRRRRTMEYILLVWNYWVSLFPENEWLGSNFNTAVVAMVLMFTVVGWILGLIFGKDPGVR